MTRWMTSLSGLQNYEVAEGAGLGGFRQVKNRAVCGRVYLCSQLGGLGKRTALGGTYFNGATECGNGRSVMHARRRYYSARNASNGEIKLARKAGTKDATSADNPSTMTATSVTTGLYGLMP